MSSTRPGTRFPQLLPALMAVFLALAAPTLHADSKEKIDTQLYIGDRVYELKTGELQSGGTAEQMKEGSLLREESREYNKLKNYFKGKDARKN